MGWLYNLLYAVAAVAYAPWLAYRVWFRRKPIAGWRQKLSGSIDCPPAKRQRIWLHAVSVGEVNLLIHLIPSLRRRFPDRELVVTTTTRTGYELACRKLDGIHVAFFPFDFTWAVRRAFRRIDPMLIVLAELEIWPNLLRRARSENIPVAVVNARLGDRSFRTYRRLGYFIRQAFSGLAVVAAQNELYAGRFKALGVPENRVAVTGNIKFDSVAAPAHLPSIDSLRDWLGIEPGDIIWLAGSTQDPEEGIALRCYQKLRTAFPNLRLILAPRHPERSSAIAQTIVSMGLNVVYRTRPRACSRCSADDVCLIDTVGELAAWWGVSQIAFVGGSLSRRGGQNMIEPSAHGCAVSFGPNTFNFRDVTELLVGGDAAVVVRDEQELLAFVRRCLEQPHWRSELGERARRLVAAQTGATETTVRALVARFGGVGGASERAA